MVKPGKRGLAPGIGVVLGLALLVGTPDARTLNVPEDYPTIQAAVSSAVDLDTISIAPGTYRGAENRDTNLGGRDLTIRSRQSSEVTVIDCESAGRAFYMDSREHATIEGLTIRNGMSASDMGGGLYGQLVTLAVKDCRFESCQSRGGGAAYLLVSTASFENCAFVGNSDHSQGGGAIWFIGGFTHKTLGCSNCLFTGNASTWLGMGGAIRIDSGGPVRFVGCTIVNNQANGLTGGVYSVDCDMVFEDCIVRGNCDPDPDTADDIYTPARTVTVSCSDVNVEGIDAAHLVIGEGVIDVDPLFCDPRICWQATMEGDYHLRSDSACLPAGSPCGSQFGALGVGCQAPVTTGACCLSDGSCVVTDGGGCAASDGTYLGDGTGCGSDPCQPTPTQRTTWGQLKAIYR